MSDTLERIIYNRPQPGAPAEPLALTPALGAEDAAAWRALVNLEPMPGDDAHASLAVGVFAGPARSFLLARAYRPRDAASPLFETISVSRRAMQQAAGHLDPFFDLLADPLPPPEGGLLPLVPLEQPDLPPWTLDERVAALHALLDTYTGGDILTALSLLGAALHERQLAICGWDGGWRARARLVQGLMALLPACVRPELTFTTSAASTAASQPRIVFADAAGTSKRWVSQPPALVIGEETLLSPYITLLADLWAGDVEKFVEKLEEMDSVAELLMPGSADLHSGLIKVAGRVDLNHRVLNGENVPPEALKAVLSGPMTLPPALHRRYAERLLDHALEARDTEAALIVAMQMDEDPALDEALGDALDEALEIQPDAVYVFVRTRLNDAMETSPRWIERLHAAAIASLDVAISDGDEATLANWLRLIAREPASYHLHDVLHRGILAARLRAHSEAELARLLLMLAVKHDPEALETLLGDEALLAAVPENMGLVLRDLGGDPLLTLHVRGPEMFSVAMARAADAHAAHQFTPEINEEIWRLYTAGPALNLPPHYQPDHIVEEWVADGAEWLSPVVLEHLLKLILADGHDSLFADMAHGLALHNRLLPLLGPALQACQRSASDIITLVGQLVTRGDLSQQDAVNTYLELAALREWRQAALPLVEQVARMAQQNPALDIPQESAWNLLEMAARSRAETVARLAARQLFTDVEALDLDSAEGDESLTTLVDTLARVTEQLQWSHAVRQYVLSWWRDLVRRQPIAHLTRLDKQVEGRRSLDDARAILQTTLAFRRMLGTRSWPDFVRDINTAFAVLEDLAESFEPSPKRPFSFDQDTIRAELDARSDELTDQERRILARNFKEMAQMIGEMGDHRSRASLIRRSENVDRHLMTGEQQPASAVDAMKWMAGYLDGVQGGHEDDE